MPRLPVRAALLLTVLLVVAAAAPAGAAEGIMPLWQVQKGMRCTAFSVVQGTQISSFDAEVLDVIAGDDSTESPRILVSVSGDAVDRTGLGPGFSGSPVVCRDPDGVERYAGAISESVGEYGGRVALATPMESVVGVPVDPPPATPRGRAAMRRARPLTGPLSFGGLSPRVARWLSRLAGRERRALYAAPGRPRAVVFPPQQLRPGAAMSAGLASGALTVGSIGTVAYVDGDRVWSFGHPLDAAGRRSLFLQDAYVYTVVNNPVQVEGVSTYKLAAPGHDVGIITADGLQSVAGRLGALPARFPMQVAARDRDTGRGRTLGVTVADENELALPTGTSALALAGAGLIGEASATVLGSIPARQSGDMCVRFEAREFARPAEFCNRYVIRGGAGGEDPELGAGSPMVADFVDAVTRLDGFEFGTLHLTRVEAGVRLRRGLRQAHLVAVRAPGVVRRGRTVRVRVRIQHVRSDRAEWRTLSVRVPRGMPAGGRLLTLTGPSVDEAGAVEVDLAETLFGGSEEEPEDSGPRTFAELAASIEAIERYDGVRASFEPLEGDDLGELLDGEQPRGPEGAARRKRRVYRDPELRLSGTVAAPVLVRR